MKNLKNTSLALLSTLIMTTQSIVADVLTEVQLHATLGVITNFILDDSGISHNGTSYGKVTSPYTGRVWLDRNLGASKVCASLDDAACYGGYYQWGRNTDGHQKSNSFDYPVLASNVTNVGHGDFITSGTLPNDWASVDATGVERTVNWSATDGSSVCPVGFRVPSTAELSAELHDAGSAQISNNTDAFNSFLKFPSAGIRERDTSDLSDVGVWGDIWSSSATGPNGEYFNFNSISTNSSAVSRAYGLSVRCIKARVIQHNGTTYGEVISPYTGKVWLDRNLGANRVCASLDDAECYGDYYQWGRNADGHEKSTSSSTSSSADNIANVGHGNFITNSTFPNDWASVDVAGAGRTGNWSATDGSSVCPTGFRVPSLVELEAELLDVGSAEIANNTDAFNSFLKFPSEGSRYYGFASLSGQGSWGSVWSSVVSGTDSFRVSFNGGGTNSYASRRAYGITVRCLRD